MHNRALRLGLLLAVAYPAAAQQLVRADLVYKAPGNGPAPNFSPYGTQVKLSDAPSDYALPQGAARPAKIGAMEVGPNSKSWLRFLVTADSAHPQDYCRLYIDRNRNLDFGDDGPAIVAKPTQNEKTKAWWSSFNDAEVSIPYGAGVVERYMVNFWAVREGDLVPDIIRFSVRSWRSGMVKVGGVDALVALMDGNNDAIFSDKDKWSVLSAAGKDAPKRVLSIAEARPTSRLMFVDNGAGKELVLEFRGVSPDGRSITFAVLDRPVTKAEDRAPDDTLASERARPRTTQSFPWADNDLDRGLAQAKATGHKVIVDFWATWCGPCHSLDEWIWSDAEVAGLLNASYVGVKLDADLKKDLVARFHVEGYPTLIVLDPTGKEIRRFGYLPSKQMLEILQRQ